MLTQWRPAVATLSRAPLRPMARGREGRGLPDGMPSWLPILRALTVLRGRRGQDAFSQHKGHCRPCGNGGARLRARPEPGARGGARRGGRHRGRAGDGPADIGRGRAGCGHHAGGAGSGTRVRRGGVVCGRVDKRDPCRTRCRNGLRGRIGRGGHCRDACGRDQFRQGGPRRCDGRAGGRAHRERQRVAGSLLYRRRPGRKAHGQRLHHGGGRLGRRGRGSRRHLRLRGLRVSVVPRHRRFIRYEI